MSEHEPWQNRVLIEKIEIDTLTLTKMANGNIWIERESGEGAEFPIDAVEKALTKFYNDNF